MFKYMALYSMVQFVTLYKNKTNLADVQFLCIDLASTTTIAVVMGRTEPYAHLVPKRPMGSLISFRNIVSILLQILASCTVQLAAISYLKEQPWYQSVVSLDPNDPNKLCWETTTIFSVSAFQYLILALVFSKGPPFRKPFYTNGWFLLAHAVLTATTRLVAVYPYGILATIFIIMPVTPETANFRYILLAFPAINTLISLYFENYLATSGMVKRVGKWVCRRKKRQRYKDLLECMDNDSAWPLIKIT